MEEQFDREIVCNNEEDLLSQDSENYNEQYMQMVKDQMNEEAPSPKL